MGKARQFRNKDRSFAERRRARENTWNDKAPRKAYEDIVKENAEFETYYKMQNICSESEWPVFMAAIKENLPTAFRITGSKSEAQAFLNIVKGELFKDFLNPTVKVEDVTSVDNSTEDVEELKPICLPWYPDNLAWQLKLTRKDIRRSELYFRLHNFLISETGCGNISRQEVVSMIPPLVLDVQSHHKVMDMCAAPGSKTAQLIELLHSESRKLPTGFVIANDVDNKRCYMLVHQAKRLSSPCIIITNHDSAVMPNFTVTNEDGSTGVLKFDRVLCDVPCSGDGTLRKNPDIWLKWNAANGNNLHGVQYRILRRGVEMLAVGGRLVYSTCSLNPLENEAVLHRLLVETEGAVKLVDVSSKLPGLKYNPGLNHWLPASRDLQGYTTFEDVPVKWLTQVRPNMFPPAPQDYSLYNLDRCIRILPHHQDTGGFFVAVVEKLGSLPWESRAMTSVSTENTTCDATAGEATAPANSSFMDTSAVTEGPAEPSLTREPSRKRRRIQGYKEDPFVFFENEQVLWSSIRDFYHIDSQLSPTCFLTRCMFGKKKNIYFTSPAVRDIVMYNQEKIKLINTGVKTFVRCDNKAMECAFRLAQEGLKSIIPFIGPNRKVSVTKDDLINLLSSEDPKFPPEIITLHSSTQEQLQHVAQGSCVLEYREKEGSAPLHLDMVGWRGNKSVRAYVPTNDCVHYLRLLGVDVSKFDVNKFKPKPEAGDGIKQEGMEVGNDKNGEEVEEKETLEGQGEGA